MSNLLKEWNHLAFGKKNTSINERRKAKPYTGPDLIETLKEVDPQLKKYHWHITLENFDARSILMSMENPYAQHTDDPSVGLVTSGRDEGEQSISVTVPGTVEAGLGMKNVQTGRNIGLTVGGYFEENPDQGFLFLERMKEELPDVYSALSATVMQRMK